MATRKLTVDIVAVLKGTGLKTLDKQLTKAKGKFSSMSKLMNNSFVQMGAGFFGVATAVNTYKKAVEGANAQLEQEVKLRSTLLGQGFREEQIDSVKAYASELQNLGIVGDEVTLAGAQQLATYNLTEQQLKDLLPALQDVAVQQDGYNVSMGTATNVANMLAKGIMGQTGELRQAGITLNEYQEGLIKTGTQSEKVAAIIEAVRMNVGEQNKEFAATPEGKIIQVQNRIGDVYENLGFQLKKSRVGLFNFVDENLAGIEKFVLTGLEFFQEFGGGVVGVISDTWDGFQSMPEDVKSIIKLVGGFFLIAQFPIAAGIIVLQDLWAAFSGGKSVTEDIFDSVMEFFESDYKFKEFRDDVKAIWEAFNEWGGLTKIFTFIGDVIQTSLIDPIKAFFDYTIQILEFIDKFAIKGSIRPDITPGRLKKEGAPATGGLEKNRIPVLNGGNITITQGDTIINGATDINEVEKVVKKKQAELLEKVHLSRRGRGNR